MGLIAVGLVFLGYSGALWGISLITGKNVSLAQLMNPGGHDTDLQRPFSQWPKAGNTVLIPNGTAADSVSAATAATAAQGGATGASLGALSIAVLPPTEAQVANQQALHTAASAEGWGTGPQWNAVTAIVASESGGNSHIANPSGAFGIGQALGHGARCSAAHNVSYTIAGNPPQHVTGTVNQYGPQYGLSCAEARAANSGDAYQQARWTIGYIKARYGTPGAAWGFHLANGFY